MAQSQPSDDLTLRARSAMQTAAASAATPDALSAGALAAAGLIDVFDTVSLVRLSNWLTRLGGETLAEWFYARITELARTTADQTERVQHLAAALANAQQTDAELRAELEHFVQAIDPALLANTGRTTQPSQTSSNSGQSGGINIQGATIGSIGSIVGGDYRQSGVHIHDNHGIINAPVITGDVGTVFDQRGAQTSASNSASASGEATIARPDRP